MKSEEILLATVKAAQKRIGSKLTELRKKKGFESHEDFAYDNEIPRVQYWRIEKGETNLTLKSLIKILTVHKLTLEEFFQLLQRDSKK